MIIVSLPATLGKFSIQHPPYNNNRDFCLFFLEDILHSKSLTSMSASMPLSPTTHLADLHVSPMTVRSQQESSILQIETDLIFPSCHYITFWCGHWGKRIQTLLRETGTFSWFTGKLAQHRSECIWPGCQGHGARPVFTRGDQQGGIWWDSVSNGNKICHYSE